MDLNFRDADFGSNAMVELVYFDVDEADNDDNFDYDVVAVDNAVLLECFFLF